MSSAPVLTLAEMIDRAAASGAEIVILPDGDRIDVGRLWADSRRAVGAVSAHERIACSLTTSFDCLAVLLAAIRTGTDVVSLPLPPRGTPVDEYQSFVAAAVSRTGAGAVFVDDGLLSALPPLVVPTVGYGAARAGTPLDGDSGGFTLVQYTSGSTGDPKGVVLPESSILANVESVHRRLATDPSDILCSWLPLSHDMGLIGTLFTALRTLTDARGATGRIVFVRPEWFIRRPASWLEAVSEYGATITAGPDFGYARALDAPYSGSLDLSSLRVAIVGAEPVRPDTLRRCEDRFGPLGFGPTTFSPAYGLAESTLAVTLVGPDDRWSSVVLDPGALEHGRVQPSDTGIEIVAAGPVLDGHGIAIRSEQGGAPGEVIGRVAVSGPSLMDGYDDGRRPFDPTGALLTEDLGFRGDGGLHLTGRRDDMLMIAGRNLNAVDIQRAASVPGVRSGTEVAIADPEQSGFVVVVEIDDEVDTAALERVAQAVRASVNTAVAAAPNAVLIAKRGSVPRTSSGKPRRRTLEALIAADELELRQSRRFR